MGNQHLPKGEPCPCRPSSLLHQPSSSGAAHGGDPCSPFKASLPSITPGDFLQEFERVQVSFQPWKKAITSLVLSPQQHIAELGLAVGSHPKYPGTCGLWRVSSWRSRQAGLCQDAIIWEELPNVPPKPLHAQLMAITTLLYFQNTEERFWLMPGCPFFFKEAGGSQQNA